MNNLKTSVSLQANPIAGLRLCYSVCFIVTATLSGLTGHLTLFEQEQGNPPSSRFFQWTIPLKEEASLLRNILP